MQEAARKYKVVIVGDTFTGKTSIINRACFDKEPIDDEQTTIGASTHEYLPKTTETECRLVLWDTAGQERYRSIVPMYFQEASLIVVVFDVTKRQTFENLPYWLSSIVESDAQKVPIMIAGNKVDLVDDRNVSHIEAKEWSENVKECKIVAYMETSAKTGEGISEIFEGAAEYLLAKGGQYDSPASSAAICPTECETKRRFCC